MQQSVPLFQFLYLLVDCKDDTLRPSAFLVHIVNSHLVSAHLPDRGSLSAQRAVRSLFTCSKDTSDHGRNNFRLTQMCSDIGMCWSCSGYCPGRAALTLLSGIPWNVAATRYLGSGRRPDFHTTTSPPMFATTAAGAAYVVRTTNNPRCC